jgi:transcription antitermination factor NusG
MDRKWYIAYTMPKAEKKVHQQLKELGVISFLPLQKVVRCWSDRKKKLEIPLFPNYLFVYASNRERFDFLKLQGLARYVSFGGSPATVSNQLIDSLKRMLTGDFEVSNIGFVEGVPVRIMDGPFIGVEGILLQRRGANRLIIQITALHREVSVDVSTSSVMPIKKPAITAKVS